jgi:hypothetical protein
VIDDYPTIEAMVEDLLRGTLEDAFSDYSPRIKITARADQQYCIRWFDMDEGTFHLFGRGKDGDSRGWDEPLGTFKITIKVEKQEDARGQDH